ncbi:hypothetical protein ABKV19_026129 [Rosa sericea]
MGDVVVILSKLHEQGKLSSNTIPNPKAQYESAKAVTLRNGRVLDDATKGIRNVTKDKDSVLMSSKALQKDPAMFNCEARTSSPASPTPESKGVLEQSRRKEAKSVNLPVQISQLQQSTESSSERTRQ